MWKTTKFRTGRAPARNGTARRRSLRASTELRVWQRSRGSSRGRPRSHDATARGRGGTHSAGGPRSRGQPSRNIQQRHGPALPAFELLHELVERPGVLDVFGYSKEQVATTVLLLGGFVGARGLATGEPDDWAHRQRARADRRAPAEEAPFLQPLFFQLLCRRLLLLALADCLTCACFGI